MTNAQPDLTPENRTAVNNSFPVGSTIGQWGEVAVKRSYFPGADQWQKLLDSIPVEITRGLRDCAH
jgi:hypothetical protein